MGVAHRYAAPGPFAVAAWLFLLLPAPLMWFDVTHLWEEQQRIGESVPWSLCGLPLIAWSVARRAGGLLWPVLVAAGFAVMSLVTWVYLFPVPGDLRLPAWMTVVPVGAGLAAWAGSGRFRPAGPPLLDDGAHRAWTGRSVAAAVTAALGAALAPATVSLAAVAATPGEVAGGVWFEDGETIGVPPTATALYAVGRPPRRWDCRITGGGAVDPMALTPGGFHESGSDFASYTWLATVHAPGGSSLTCRAGDPDPRFSATFALGPKPDVRGAARHLTHWPVLVLMLLGALPGLVVLATEPYPLHRTPAGRRRAVSKPRK